MIRVNHIVFYKLMYHKILGFFLKKRKDEFNLIKNVIVISNVSKIYFLGIKVIQIDKIDFYKVVKFFGIPVIVIKEDDRFKTYWFFGICILSLFFNKSKATLSTAEKSASTEKKPENNIIAHYINNFR